MTVKDADLALSTVRSRGSQATYNELRSYLQLVRLSGADQECLSADQKHVLTSVRLKDRRVSIKSETLRASLNMACSSCESLEDV